MKSSDATFASRARNAGVRRVFIITLVLNLVVAGAKGIYSSLSGSVTLGADSFHSLLDGLANILALVGMHFVATPADAGHPYGHRKFEMIAALGIGVLIAVSLVEIGGAAFSSLRHSTPPPDIGWPGFAVVIGTMAVNLGVTRYEHAEGHRLKSPLLLADARHTQSDLYASGAVLASFIGARFGIRWADGLGGLVVVILVGRVAWDVFRENIPTLVDAAVLDPKDIRALAAPLQSDGLRDVHAVRSRGTRFAAELDLHLTVDPNMSVRDAHALSHRLEDLLRGDLPHLTDVVIHVEPFVDDAGLLTPEPLKEDPPSSDSNT